MKTFAFLSLLLLTAGLSAAAQPAPRAAFDLNAPENGSKVGNPTVVFSWDYIDTAQYFFLKLQRVDTTEAVTLPANGTDCFMLSCSLTFDPAHYDWVWKEGAAYTWYVKAKNTEGASLGKSKTWTFTVDMFKKITIESPVEGETVISEDYFDSTYILVDWSAPIDREIPYNLTLYSASGSIAGESIGYQANCAATCSHYIYYTGLLHGQTKTFYLQIVGKDVSVKGKAKSPKIRIRIFWP